MNRILNVDTRNHTMLVEPGVSFYDVPPPIMTTS